MSNNHLVFVYGTLRENEPNYNLLENAIRVASQCWTGGVLYDTGSGYPVMGVSSLHRVYGEVYEVTTDTLHQLDELEGFRGSTEKNLCERVSQTIYSDRGAMEASVYINGAFPLEQLEEVKFGDWKCHRYLEDDSFRYFAYGSCMDSERFTTAGVAEHFTKVIGCGKANNFSLAFTRAAEDGGRADIIESDGYVEGKVYELNKEALEYLFVREGVQGQLYRPAFVSVDVDGKVLQNVLTFIVIDKSTEIAPPIHYAIEILRGASGVVSDQYYHQIEEDLFRKFQLKIDIQKDLEVANS
ncbi:gamma-glutamylcyclotransferase [Sediminibacillus halophilus]|uniref:Gamma-glutamylcyclotransferase family protein n=1 Tax=Sediminibacillus halophilus TaxID=482461 RepID=A0A1G9M5F2_9BACI|nr:gamma-glutamylcyclotransferase family protein [Sediminibacillus halophilus]SDL69436.1 Cation transport regulator ChaC [Sediminibacillus halophilus]